MKQPKAIQHGQNNMNVVKEYFEQLFMVLGSQSRRIQNIDNTVNEIKTSIKSKSSKKTRQV